uniref:TANGO6 N-terminal domain-containing protein n=1 Tax=Eptatretus burgeri TaxID=7764 RepID=A0A8C4QEQ9_EPTBU
MSFASITDALKILVSPAEPLGGSADPSNALSASLKTNLDRLNSQLKEDPRFDDVWRLEDRLKSEGSEAFRFSKHLFVAHECDDVTWRFATKCLHLLLGLKLTMEDIRTSWKQAPSLRRTPLAAPSLPPDVLSVGQQQTVRAALQFVSALGICPYLLSGVGVPWSSRSGFGPLLQKMTTANAATWGTCDSSICKSRLVVCCSGMLVISEDPSLGSLVLARHLGDLLAALIQLCYSPIKASWRSAIL